jgi:hypothetical protein
MGSDVFMPPRYCCDSPANGYHQGICPNSYMSCGEDRKHVNHIMKKETTTKAEYPISEKDWEAAQLNVLPTTRIGWETRQQYLDRLIEAHVNGHIDGDTFENRKQWVENAYTKEQVELAVKDLPALKAAEAEPQPKKAKRKDPTPPLAVFTIMSAFAIVFAPLVVIAAIITIIRFAGW